MNVDALFHVQDPQRPMSGNPMRLSPGSATVCLSISSGQPSVCQCSGAGIMDPECPFVQPRPSKEMVHFAVPPFNTLRRQTSKRVSTSS